MALFNGNISQSNWSTASANGSKFWYIYHYDALNRINEAQFAGGDFTNRYSLENVAYDKNGNIQGLIRRGHTNADATLFGTMDNLVYTYDSGNKLTKVLDNGNDTYGFVDGADQAKEYAYDTNGNMVVDRNKGITGIEYNHLNLPVKVNFIGGGVINYVYDAAGMKQEKTASNGMYTEYAGNYVYENGNLQFFNHPEGYVDVADGNYSYVYRFKDHLENIRLSYTDANGDGTIDPSNEIIKETNYYPFGLKHKGYNSATSPLGNDVAQRYKTYQGQEFTDDFGLNFHEWKYRISDPAIGRFWQVDPLAEDYVYNSTYAFAENKLGMGIELEGAELLGFDVAQDIIQRGISFFDGADKMITGGSNMLNQSMSGQNVEKIMNENSQTTNNQGPQIDPNLEMVMDGAGQMSKALPNKNDARNLANGLEVAGDVITIGGTATGQPEVIVIGEVTNGLGVGVNAGMDFMEGRPLLDVTIEAGIKVTLGQFSRAAKLATRSSAGKKAVEAGETLGSDAMIKVHEVGYGHIMDQIINDDDNKDKR